MVSHLIEEQLNRLPHKSGVYLMRDTEGNILYVADEGADKTYVYSINPDGTLSDKKLFAREGDDGMTVDTGGNIYLTSHNVHYVSVYNPEGHIIEVIEVPEQPRNLCFGGSDRKTLFFTARSSLYSIRMRTQGL